MCHFLNVSASKPICKYIPRTDLLVREVDSETVILDRQADMIHSLNPTASFIWNALPHLRAAEDIAQALADTFEIDPEIATADVIKTLGDFRALRLIHTE